MQKASSKCLIVHWISLCNIAVILGLGTKGFILVSNVAVRKIFKLKTSSILFFYMRRFHDLIPFVKFTKCEKHPWGSDSCRLQSATLLKVTFLHGCFSRFLKLYKWYQIVQRIIDIIFPLGKIFIGNQDFKN